MKLTGGTTPTAKPADGEAPTLAEKCECGGRSQYYPKQDHADIEIGM